MTFRQLPLLILGASLLPDTPSFAEAAGETIANEAAETLTVLPNVAFLDAGREEKLDLYLPKDDGKNTTRPAMVYIHGGAFTGGDKAQASVVSNCKRLVREGFVVASINYALVKTGPTWPLPLLDCKNAVRFLRANAEKYHVDPDRIAVMGSSAGGTLALLVAFTAGLEELEPASPWPGVSSEVNAVVNFYGGTNFTTRKKTDKDGRPTEEPDYDNGALCGNDPVLRAAISPVNYVRKGLSPVFTAHGKKDGTVDRLQPVELAEALNKAGVPNQLILLETAGHSFTFDLWRKRPLETDLLPPVIAFLREAPASSGTAPLKK